MRWGRRELLLSTWRGSSARVINAQMDLLLENLIYIFRAKVLRSGKGSIPEE